PPAPAGAFAFPRAPPPRAPPPRAPRPPAPGSTILRYVGSSFETIYMVPFVGSTAELPQLAPPLWPGNSIVPFMLGGVNRPSLRESRNRWRAASCCSAVRNGLMSFSVKDWRAKGRGRVGKGCVSDVYSPGTSDWGTGRSSMGHRGSPVLRLNTN